MENMTEPGYLCLKKTLPGMGRDVTSLSKKTFKKEYFVYPGTIITYNDFT